MLKREKVVIEMRFQLRNGNLLASAFCIFSQNQLKINFWLRSVSEKELVLIFLEQNTQIC